MQLQHMIEEGNKSLAERTLQALNDFRRGISHTTIDTLQVLKEAESVFHKIAHDGNISSDYFDNFSIINQLCNIGINSTLLSIGYPLRSFEILDFVWESIIAYTGSETDLKKAAKIDQYIPSPSMSSIVDGVKDGNISRVFFYMANPGDVVFSIIVNTNELCKITFPEFSSFKKFQTDFEAQFHSVLKALSNNHDLASRFTQQYNQSSYLHLFRWPELQDMADNLGVKNELNDFLDANTAKFDYLYSLMIGQGYVITPDVLKASPRYNNLPFVQDAFRLFALNYALATQVIHKDEPSCIVGVGLAEYFKNHPDKKKELENSPEFHKELSTKYFSSK